MACKIIARQNIYTLSNNTLQSSYRATWIYRREQSLCHHLGKWSNSELLILGHADVLSFPVWCDIKPTVSHWCVPPQPSLCSLQDIHEGDRLNGNGNQTNPEYKKFYKTTRMNSKMSIPWKKISGLEKEKKETE